MKFLLAAILVLAHVPNVALGQKPGQEPMRGGRVRRPIVVPKLAWAFSSIHKGEAPSTVVYLVVGSQKVKIAKVGNEPHEITGQDRQNNHVPAPALTACFGWWAGGGDVFYVLRLGRSLKVYHRFLEEGDAPLPPFLAIKTISL